MRPSRVVLGAGILALALVAASGCSDWPPGDRGDGGSSAPVRDGFCGGRPLPCSGLDGEQCAALPGCDDLGVCSGSGATCGTERSFAGCLAAGNCFWSPSCSGVPVGCIATTKKSCEVMAGCVWTPSGRGSGGSGSGGSGAGGEAPNCPSLDTSCTSSATCDCNMQCLQTCNNCPTTCAKACRSDSDCVNTGGNGMKTPFCVKMTATTTACSPFPSP